MSGRAGAAARAASDTARAWGGHAVALAGIGAALRDCWSGQAAAATAVELDALAGHIDELVADLVHLAETLEVEGAALERAVDDGEAGAAAAADAALLARLQISRSVDRMRAALQGPALPGAVVGPLPAVPELGPGVDAATVAATWHGLSPVQRSAFLEANPGIEDRSGLPIDARDAANRSELAAVLADPAGPGRADPDRTGALAEHLSAHPETRVLALDGAGRGTVADGDPGAAGQVVTFVPGTGSSMAGVADAAGDAAALCAAAAPDGNCVAVTFLDQDAPESVPVAAVDRERAAEAAARLQDLQNSLRDAGAGELDVVGYSYGGVLAGAAAALPAGLAADQLLFLAAPGSTVDHVSELRLSGDDEVPRPGDSTSVAALAERWDPVPWWALTGIHGAGPMDPDFGADRHTVDSVETVADLDDTHTGYFDPGSIPLAEIGRILAARP